MGEFNALSRPLIEAVVFIHHAATFLDQILVGNARALRVLISVFLPFVTPGTETLGGVLRVCVDVDTSGISSLFSLLKRVSNCSVGCCQFSSLVGLTFAIERLRNISAVIVTIVNANASGCTYLAITSRRAIGVNSVSAAGTV